VFRVPILFLSLGSSLIAFAQEAKDPKDQPQVRVNYLNVCTPPEADQHELHTSFARIPQPQFAPDFEVSRGRSTIENSPTASWVRVRREFAPSAPFIAAQYAISVDDKSIVETLVFRSREAKDVLQVQFENTVTGAQNATAVIQSDTPVDRMKLERLGKPSVVLSRCPTADQSAYEPLFREASGILARYRAAMGIKRMVPRELQMLGALPSDKPKPVMKKDAKK
jgi:hypothetical protein